MGLIWPPPKATRAVGAPSDVAGRLLVVTPHTRTAMSAPCEVPHQQNDDRRGDQAGQEQFGLGYLTTLGLVAMIIAVIALAWKATPSTPSSRSGSPAS